ncbi:hypothetical protein HDU99_008431 [Rhizoclosmatium hyalinum]|nr:hypothetical protein HDU99_008431 [Rhizoclosmatium hyalinum]
MHFPEIPAQTQPVCIFASDTTFSSHSLDEIDYIPSLDLLGNLLFADFPVQQLDEIEMMEFIYTPSAKQHTQVENSVLLNAVTTIEEDALLASIRGLKALIDTSALNYENLFKSYPNINQKHKDDVTDISSKMKGAVFLIEQKLEMSRSHSEGFEAKSTQAEESVTNILETKIDITTEGIVVADLETVVASQNQELICAIAGKSESEDDNTAVLVSDINFELGVPQAFGKEALYQRIGKNVDTLDDATIDSFVASEPMVENTMKLLRKGDGLEIKLDAMKELLQKALIYFLNFFDIQDNFLDCELDLDALIKKRNKRKLRKMETLKNF